MRQPIKPAHMHNRDSDWEILARFVTTSTPYPALGIAYGRRRQGKSYLLRSMCQVAGGFYFEAPEGNSREVLELLGERLAEHLRVPGRLTFPHWPAAIAGLMQLGERGSTPVVLDEFQRLVAADAALPSIVQGALPPRAGEPAGGQTRLILCGSALSIMAGLLSGESPLRGRASLEMHIEPFDYREAARFWGLIEKPALAVRVFAVVGGTPAYRREFVNDDAPTEMADFDAWVLRTALNPACPLFREGRYLLAEEPGLRDHALHHSVLAALSNGHTTRGAIASSLGRPVTDMAHPLTILEDVGFVERRRDIFGGRTSTFHVREPIVRFYHAIARPHWAAYSQRSGAAELWARSQDTFGAQLLGPAFEELAREYVRRHASAELGFEVIAEVGAGIVSDTARKTRHEIDVAAFGVSASVGRQPGGVSESGRPRRIVVLGEAKAGRALDVADLERLERIRALLTLRSDEFDTTECRLLLFSGGGFSTALQSEARRGRCQLIDVERMYGVGIPDKHDS